MKDQHETQQHLIQELTQLRQSEQRYRTLAEATTDIIYILDEAGKLLYANRSAAAYVGLSPASLVGKNQTDLFPPDVAERHSARVRRVFETGEAGEMDELYRFGSRDVWLNVRSIPLRDEHGRVTSVMGVCRDITERKQAQEALKRAHDELEQRVEQRTAELMAANEQLRQLSERLSLATSAASVGIWDQDIPSNKLVWDDSMFRLYGIAPNDFGGAYEAWQAGVHPEDLPGADAEVQMALRGEKEFDTEFRVVWPDKSVHWIKASAVVQHDASGRPLRMLGTNWDITERKRAEEALEKERQTLWHMLQASDHERQLIAYEIHDGLAQYLAAAGMQFQTYAHLRENDPDQAKKAYDAATQLVSQSYFEARRLISGVRPPVLDEAGVETAIAHLVHDERVFKGLKIELQSEIQFDRLPNILENALYRIAQEALTNAWKHSKSKKVKVRLLQEGQKIRLEVQDWGIGFEPEAVEKGHFGLEGIRERVRLLGGKLVIQSSPGRGTLIRVELPIVVRKQGD